MHVFFLKQSFFPSYCYSVKKKKKIKCPYKTEYFYITTNLGMGRYWLWFFTSTLKPLIEKGSLNYPSNMLAGKKIKNKNPSAVRKVESI